MTKDGRPLVLGRTGIEILAPKYRAEAKARAEQIAPVIRDLQQRGYSMRGIAVELDNCKVETPHGGLAPADGQPRGRAPRILTTNIPPAMPQDNSNEMKDYPQLVTRIVQRLVDQPA